MPCNEGGDHIRRSREFYVFGKLGVLGSGESGVAWEGRALARPLHRAGARRSREFYVFGKLGVLGSGESGVAWEGRIWSPPSLQGVQLVITRAGCLSYIRPPCAAQSCGP